MPKIPAVHGAERRQRSLDRARRLLILDHDAWSRALADGLLRAKGYRVVCTGDTEMAARLAREMVPDLVLVDLSLKVLFPAPRRSGDPKSTSDRSLVDEGYALLRPLELASVPKADPVVLLTSPEAGADSVRFSLAALLEKPFTPETLLGRVGEILGGPTRTLEEAAVRKHLEADGMLLGGRIEVVGVPGILQLCHNTVLSGVCTLEALDGRTARVYFRRGEIVASKGPKALEGLDSIVEIVSWVDGRFDFVPGNPDERQPLGAFDALLLEGCRRMDERDRLDWKPYPKRARETESDA